MRLIQTILTKLSPFLHLALTIKTRAQKELSKHFSIILPPLTKEESEINSSQNP